MRIILVSVDSHVHELLSGRGGTAVINRCSGLQVIIEQTNGSYADILERTDEAVVFKNPAKEAVVLA